MGKKCVSIEYHLSIKFLAGFHQNSDKVLHFIIPQDAAPKQLHEKKAADQLGRLPFCDNDSLKTAATVAKVLQEGRKVKL